MLSSLKGSRTYIIASLIGALSALKYLGYVDEQMFQTFLGLLMGGGLATMRSAIASPYSEPPQLK